MRRHLFFLIIWGLLCVFAIAEIGDSVGQYRLAKDMEHILGDRTLPKRSADELTLIKEKQTEYLRNSAGASVELILLGLLCMAYFKLAKTTRAELGDH